jgi:hypothetical protein
MNKLIVSIGLTLISSTSFAYQNLIVNNKSDSEVSVYCLSSEVAPTYKEGVPTIVVEAHSSSSLGLSTYLPKVGCNVFNNKLLLGNFGFGVADNGLLYVFSAGYLQNTDYTPANNNYAPNVHITIQQPQ